MQRTEVTLSMLVRCLKVCRASIQGCVEKTQGNPKYLLFKEFVNDSGCCLH